MIMLDEGAPMIMLDERASVCPSPSVFFDAYPIHMVNLSSHELDARNACSLSRFTPCLNGMLVVFWEWCKAQADIIFSYNPRDPFLVFRYAKL